MKKHKNSIFLSNDFKSVFALINTKLTHAILFIAIPKCRILLTTSTSINKLYVFSILLTKLKNKKKYIKIKYNFKVKILKTYSMILICFLVINLINLSNSSFLLL